LFEADKFPPGISDFSQFSPVELRIHTKGREQEEEKTATQVFEACFYTDNQCCKNLSYFKAPPV
jgi:hypothetical protein